MSTNNSLTRQQRDEVDVIINDHADRIDDIVNKNVLVCAIVSGFLALVIYLLVTFFTDKSMEWWGLVVWVVFGALIGVVVGAFRKPQVSTTVTEGRFTRRHEPARSEQETTKSEPILLLKITLMSCILFIGVLLGLYLARVLLSSSDWQWGLAVGIAVFGFASGVAYGGLKYLRRQGGGGSDTKLFGVVFGIVMGWFAPTGVAMALGISLHWIFFVLTVIIGALIGYKMVGQYEPKST